MPKPCCKELKYLGDSHLEHRHKGQCLKCGTIYHSFKCNWRTVNRNGVAVLVQVKDAKEKTDKKPRRITPEISLGLLSAGGFTMENIIAALRKAGVEVRND